MGNLAELLALAEHQDRVKNPWIGTTEKAVGGFMGGMQMRQQMQSAQAERALKMLEIQEKMQKMEADAVDLRIKTNMAKGMGLLPMEQDEKSVLGKLFFDGLNKEKNTTQVNTEMGRMADPSFASKLLGGNKDYDMLPEYSDGKLFIKPHKKRSEADSYWSDRRAQESAERHQKRIMDEATKAAQQHEYQRLTYGMSPEDVQGAAYNVSSTKVTPDMVSKYIPAIEAYYKKDMKTFNKMMTEREAEIMTPLIDKELRDLEGEMWLSKSQKAKKAELETRKSKYTGKPAAPPVNDKAAEDFRNWIKGRKK